MGIGDWFKKPERDNESKIIEPRSINDFSAAYRDNIEIQRDVTQEELKMVLQQFVDEKKTTVQELRTRIDGLRYAEARRLNPQQLDISLETIDFRRSMERDYQTMIKLLSPDKFFLMWKTALSDKYLCVPEFDEEIKKSEKRKKLELTYCVPELQEILSWVTPEQIRLYHQMKNRNFDPRLILVPIGCDLEEKLNEKFKNCSWKKPDSNKIDFQINPILMKYDPYYLYRNDLRYEPSEFKIWKNQIIFVGGKTRQELTIDNEGWLIRIVAMRPKIEAVIKNKSEAVEQFNYLIRSGYRGLDFGTYSIAHALAWENGEILDEQAGTIIPESCVPKQLKFKRFFFDKCVMESLPVGRVLEDEKKHKALELRDFMHDNELLSMRFCIPINRPRNE